MTVTATSSIAKIMHNAENLLANCATFQQMCNVNSAAGAKGSIYIPYEPDGIEDKCFATICFESDYVANLLAFGTKEFQTGTVGIVIFYPVPTANQNDIKDAFYDFLNNIGAIQREINELRSGSDAHLYLSNIDRINWIIPPGRTSEEERQNGRDYYICALGLGFYGN